MKKFTRSLGALALALTLTAPAHADVVLDMFSYTDTNGNPVPTFNLSGFSGFSTTQTGLNTPFAEVEYALTTGSTAVNPLVTSGGGQFEFYSGSELGSTLDITYTGDAIDFTQYGDYFYVSIDKLDTVRVDNNPANDLGMEYSISMTSELGSASYSNTFNTYVPTGSNYILTIPFTAFSFSGLFNPLAVTEATLSIANEGDGVDLILNEFGIVPAPAAIGLLGLGLMGLGMSRRRKAAK